MFAVWGGSWIREVELGLEGGCGILGMVSPPPATIPPCPVASQPCTPAGLHTGPESLSLASNNGREGPSSRERPTMVPTGAASSQVAAHRLEPLLCCSCCPLGNTAASQLRVQRASFSRIHGFRKAAPWGSRLSPLVAGPVGGLQHDHH